MIKNSMLSFSHINIFTLIIFFTFIFLPQSILAKAAPSPENISGTTKIDAEKLINLVEQKNNVIIIDSRIKSDRNQGYLDGSNSLPDEETTCSTLSNIIKTKKYHVVFYCNGPKCGRSAIAVKIAISCGYTNIYWFRGGYEEWTRKKYPVVKD